MANKTLLNRGARVEIPNQVTRTDLGIKSSQNETIGTSVTEQINVRVDNHIRNKLSAFVELGHASSLKDMVRQLVDRHIETLNEDNLENFNNLVKIYEKRDAIKHHKKKNSKDN